MGESQVVGAVAAKTGTGDVAVNVETRESAEVLLFPVNIELPVNIERSARKKQARPPGRPKGRKKS